VPTLLVAHLIFCNHTKPIKKSKRATKTTHQDRHEMTTNKHDRQEGQLVTAVTVAQPSFLGEALSYHVKKRQH